MTRHHPAKEVELRREGEEYVVLFELAGYEPADIDVRWRDRRARTGDESAAFWPRSADGGT